MSLQRNSENGSLWNNLTYSYNSTSNRLQSVTDVAGSLSATFTYDANGNMKSQTGKFADIDYEHRNLPTWFHTTSGPDVKAYYNAGGQRILKELTNGDYEFYVKDGPLTLAIIDQNGFSHFNLIGNGVFGRLEPSGARRYYLKDHLGSTRLVRNNSGTILSTFDYYPFGLLMPGRYSTSNNTIEKFTGKQLDSELGLYYFGMRYLDPALGRWFSPDPLAQKHPEWSTYNYALNNPLYYIDPDGRQIAAPLFNAGFRKGVTNALVSSWQGVKNLANDPVGTARAMGSAIYHYKRTYRMFKAGVSKRWGMVTSGNPYKMGQVAGEGFVMGAGILATKGAGALAKSGVRLLKGVDEAAGLTKVARSLDNLGSLRGAKWSEVEGLIPKDWIKTSLKKGKGIKFINPNKRGEQILLEKGWPGAKDPLHAGPYIKISRNGKITRIPLKGNPVLKDIE